jgi:hypothetical protein
MENQANNPLKQYFRQPKIYLRLPSSGNFYPEGTLEKTETGDLPVYAMTAKDELIFKTPDALLNGQATVEVIKSCVPNIKDPWVIPSIDLDAILVAIRMATYGDKLDIDVTIPKIEEERTYELDLRMVLDSLLENAFDSEIVVDDTMTVFIRPLTYKEFTQTALKTLEEQRIFNIVNDETISEEKKLELFSLSFRKLTDININIVINSIFKIVVPNAEVTDPKHIAEFINNADKQFYGKILDHFDVQKDKFTIKPFVLTTTAEDQEAGAPKTIEIPITLDQSNFFA